MLNYYIKNIKTYLHEKMLKKERFNKKFLRTYFLIFNLILATIAIAYLIGAVDAADNCPGGVCPVNKGSSGSGNLDPSTGWGGGNGFNVGNNAGAGWGNQPSATPNPTNLDTSGWGGGSGFGVGGNPNTGGWGGGEPFNAPSGQTSTPSGGSNPVGGSAEGGFNSGAQPFGWGQPGGGTGNPVGPASGNPVSPGGRMPGAGGEGLPGGGTGNPVGPASGNPGGVPGATPPVYPGAPATGSPGVGGAINSYFDNLPAYLGQVAMAAGIGGMIGQFAGGKNGAMWGSIAGAAGMFAYQIAKLAGAPGLTAGLIGLAVFALIFILTYKKESKQIVEFQCLPWQAPIGGQDCERCNDFGGECGEYTCKSLGQACDIVNKGQKNQNCIWKNPHDTNSPTIEMVKVSRGHKFIPDKTIRPPATGVEILLEGGKCIKAFTPLEYTFQTNESAQCKVDYNLTTDSKTAFDAMGYYVGGDTSYVYNHSEKMSLPSPAAITDALKNVSGIQIKNDGTYTLYIRCSDANGNYNVNPFSVRFCVDPGPDTTPALIMNVSIPSGMPIQFNRTNLSVEFYINEPADCRWSKQDGLDYKYMEGNMTCDNGLWDMRDDGNYVCRARLTGIEDRKENLFYIRCLDKPDYDENERNPNRQSFLYRIIGTQPLNILKIEPNATIAGATDVMNLTLYVRTDNGYSNGNAICFFSTTGKESDYVAFSQSGGNEHFQRQDLVPRNYKYYIKCVDLGGNAAYNDTSFRIENDKISPGVIRIYKESGQIKIITNEESECSYSNINCNFEIDNGVKMSTADYINHNSDWKTNYNFFIRCKDRYNNQPNPNVCTVIIRPVDIIPQIQNLTIEL